LRKRSEPLEISVTPRDEVGPDSIDAWREAGVDRLVLSPPSFARRAEDVLATIDRTAAMIQTAV
jgi:hypothetical protein